MDGILPAKIDTYSPVLLRFPYLVFGLLNRLTESFCSAVGQHCQGQGGQVISKSNYTRRGVEIG